MITATIHEALGGHVNPVKLDDGEWYVPVAFFPSVERVVLLHHLSPALVMTSEQFSAILDKQDER